jgi:hypothetical protein
MFINAIQKTCEMYMLLKRVFLLHIERTHVTLMCSNGGRRIGGGYASEFL